MKPGFVAVMAQVRDVSPPGSRGEAVLAAFLRASVRGAIPLRDRAQGHCASAELVALLAVLQELARGGIGDTRGQAHG